MSAHILPDSRLHDRNLGAVMVDWAIPGGETVRIEVCPVFCANCGKPYGWVPKENTVFVCWLCRDCYETFGEVAGTYSVPDEEFCKKVEEEMVARFGRGLTDTELSILAERGELGRNLELLEKESPYPARDHRPRNVP